MCKHKHLFLPYQVEWLEDKSKYKIWEKSRRIGATWVQAYEDVMDCLHEDVPVVWFSSADASAAKEYIRYCAEWAKLVNLGFKQVGKAIIEPSKGVTSLSLEFSNGTRINALSSNPTAFRSKGGKVVIDEFAFHEDAKSLWAAAKPAAMWGYPVRIISTHNGKQSLYYNFIEQIKKDNLDWGLHSVNIYQAVADGLLDKIFKRHVPKNEIEAWLQAERQACASLDVWNQEYCCIAIDETTAFITYEMIERCEAFELPINELSDNTDTFIGIDIGRKHDMTVIWGVTQCNDKLYKCEYRELKKTKFAEQKAILMELIAQPNVRKVCIDSTGLGMQLAEELADMFGRGKVEQVTFTNKLKEELAYQTYITFEEAGIAIPKDKNIREDIHSIKRITTSAGNVRFDAMRTEDGHSDRFWALALAIHAAKGETYSSKIYSRSKRLTSAALDGYHIGGLKDYQ